MLVQNLLALSILAPSILAAPYKAKSKSKRQDVTYTCELSGTYKVEGSLTTGPDGINNGNPQSSGNTNGFMALSIVGSDGSDRGLNVGDDEHNPIDMGGLTITADNTALEHDISWTPHYNLAFQGCECKYGDYTNSSGAVDGSIWSSPLYNENSETCACTFPCNPPSYAAGWCGLHIAQKERDGDEVRYTVEVKDANGNAIGSAYDMGVTQGSRGWVDSNLPEDVWIENAVDDRDSIYIGYDDQSWESADTSRCSVGAYDELGFRRMDCGFTCN